MGFKLTTKPNRSTTKVDEDEFAGLWINTGVITEDKDGNESFNRLSKGIAVSDLALYPIYAKSAEKNPDWAEEATLINALTTKIQDAGKKLEEGESISLNLSVQLYRRQEQVALATAPKVDVDLDSLIGS